MAITVELRHREQAVQSQARVRGLVLKGRTLLV